MALFKKQIQYLETLEQKIFLLLRETIDNKSFIIKDYVVKKQLYDKGIDGKEKRLKGYTRTTIRYKIAKGQPADRTTLKDKGDFYASITIDVYPEHFEISSSVTHSKYLISKYGEDILKPSASNMNDFLRIHFIPLLKQKYGTLTK